MKHLNSARQQTAGTIEITLDGSPVEIPAGRSSLNSIRSHLDTLALSQQRVLSVLLVDGQPADLALSLACGVEFHHVEAESIALDCLPLLLLTTAQQQAERTRQAAEIALTLVLINHAAAARELWWDLARQLKEPVLTLSLMPENICRLCGGTAFEQLRKWQLEQIAAIVREVDSVCGFEDTLKISDALEKRVLPWLRQLNEQIYLWRESVMAGVRLGIKPGVRIV